IREQISRNACDVMVDERAEAELQLAAQQQRQQEEEAKLSDFWDQVYDEVRKATVPSDLKPLVPPTRVKKAIHYEDEVREDVGEPKYRIGSDAPILIAKAVEFFVREMTLLAAVHMENRKILQRSDVSTAISNTDTYDFLFDIVPQDDKKVHEPRTIGGSIQQLLEQQISSLQQAASAAQGRTMTGQATAEDQASQMEAMLQQQQLAVAALAQHPEMASQMQMLWQQQALLMEGGQVDPQQQALLTLM
ncbi:unnamed protein product, partial [Chrysoparadoxa australica]